MSPLPEGSESLCFALKYAPPSTHTEPSQRLTKEQYWTLLYPLTGMLQSLRQDWLDLLRPEDDPKTKLTSDDWVAQVRKRVRDLNPESQLWDQRHGPVRWKMHDDEMSFRLAPGMYVDRLEGIDESRPWFAIGIHSHTPDPYTQFVPDRSSYLFVPSERLYHYESALCLLRDDDRPSRATSRRPDASPQGLIGEFSLDHLTTCSRGQQMMTLFGIPHGSGSDDDRREFDTMVVGFGTHCVASVRHRVEEIDLLSKFDFNVYTAWPEEGSRQSDLTTCCAWMGIVAERSAPSGGDSAQTVLSQVAQQGR